VHCDNRLFEHWQEKHWEQSPTLKQFMPPMLQPKHMVFAPHDDLMQIKNRWFKSPIRQEEQYWHVNNIFLYNGESSHIISVGPKKHVQHAVCAITSITTQGPKRKGKWKCPVLVGTMRLDLSASCTQNGPTLSPLPTPCFLLPIMIKGGKPTTMRT